MTIDDIIASVVLLNEGGYVNNPADPGGETNFGITVATARSQGYAGAMRDMPRSFAVSVYRKRYADAPGFTAIGGVSMALAAVLIDTGVNMGTSTAGSFLQRSLNVLNEGGADYANLVVDGNAGSVTLAALKAYMAKRALMGGEAVLIGAVRGMRTVRYVELCEAKSSNEVFAFGWLKRATQ